MARLFLVIGICGFLSGDVYSSIYDNHTLFRFATKDYEQLEAAQHFQDPTGEVEVLKSSRGINDTLDVLVPPNRLTYVQDYAREHGLEIAGKRENYGRSFQDVSEEDEGLSRMSRRRILRHFSIYEYQSHARMQDYLDSIAAKHPRLVTLKTLGNSYQGRKIRLVQISAQPNNNNPIIFIDAGIHSREWVAPAMALYIIHRLVNDASARTSGGELDGVDWYILPLVNPDGYEYSRSSKSNRMWRKTRSKNGRCYGVDGNRNYGFKWGVSGVSRDPCNKETYAGPKAFSEPETQMVRNVLLDNSKRIKLYVSLHAYGQYLVYPWGYTGDILPHEWKKLHHLAKAVSNKVEQAGGKPFRVLSAGKWYAAAGGSDDFAFAVAGVPYSYTMELTEGHEFTYPESHLRETLPSFYEGFRAFGKQIRKEFGSGINLRHLKDPLN